MLYESCTNIFLFQSHINFNILTHVLNANFEKSLHGCRVCPTCKRKLLLTIKANAKNWGFFLFSFFFRLTDPSNFEKNSCSRKLNWSGLSGEYVDQKHYALNLCWIYFVVQVPISSFKFRV